MMKRNSIVILVLVASVLFTSPAWKSPQDGGDIQAIVVKVVNTVDKNVPARGWSKAVPLDRLRSGYEVRTQDKSYALIRFADETKLLVRQKSIVEIRGRVEGRRIVDRNVHTTRGRVAFDVKKSEREQFRFSSPISVASIRGTLGSYLADSDSLNKLIINRGLASFTSLISNQTMDVGSNQTGVTDNQGNLFVRQSTDEEQEEGEGNEPGEDETKMETKEIRIQGTDRDGNPKTVILQWKQ